MTLRIATICSGIGAPECAADVIGGFEHVFASEIEDFPSAVLAHHFPGVPNLGDFTTIGEEWNGKIDVLVGGTPCQSFSVAGKRLGLDDPRGNLTLEFLRLVGRIRPRWVVLENVPGLLLDDGGRTFSTVCNALEGFGYEVGARKVDARGWGVPQRRRRVFVVAGPRGSARSALRRDPEGCGWRAPSRFATWADEVEDDASDSEDRGGNHRGANERTIPAITASGRGTARLGESRGDDPLVVCAASKRDGMTDFGDMAPTIRSGATTAHPVIAYDSKRNVLGSVNVAPTIRAMPHSGSHSNGGGGIAIAYAPDYADPIGAHEARTSFNAGNNPRPHNLVVTVEWGGELLTIDPETLRLRRITPLECERCFAYPDGWTNIPWRGKPTAPDSRRYKALGNSMVVTVLAYILHGIRDFEEGARAYGVRETPEEIAALIAASDQPRNIEQVYRDEMRSRVERDSALAMLRRLADALESTRESEKFGLDDDIIAEARALAGG